MRKPILVIVSILLTGIGPSAFSKVKKKKSVFVDIAKIKDIFDTFSYPARIVPTVNSVVFAEGQGIVDKIRLPLGSKVKSGSIIASIKRTDPVYKYRPIKLRSPISGVISKVFVSEGTYVAKEQKIAVITDPKKNKVVIEVSAKDLKYLKTGLVGELSLKHKKEKIKVEIVGISPTLDEATGTATVELNFLDSKSKSLTYLGSLGKVSFKSNYHQGFVFTQDILNYKGSKTFVRIVDKKNKIKKVEVTLGDKRRGQVEIVKGLKDDDMVVTRSSGFLKEGSEIEVKNLPKTKANPKKDETSKVQKVKKEKV